MKFYIKGCVNLTQQIFKNTFWLNGTNVNLCFNFNSFAKLGNNLVFRTYKFLKSGLFLIYSYRLFLNSDFFGKILDTAPMVFTNCGLVKAAKLFFHKTMLFKSLTTRVRKRSKRFGRKSQRKRYFWNKQKVVITHLPVEFCDHNDLEKSFLKFKFLDLVLLRRGVLNNKFKYNMSPKILKNFNEESYYFFLNYPLLEYKTEWFFFWKTVRFSPFSTNLFLEHCAVSTAVTKVMWGFGVTHSVFSFFKRFRTLANISLYFSRELVYTNIRKDFTNFYVYRTFENAMHTFWTGFEYSKVVGFLNSYFCNYLYDCVDNFFLYDVLLDDDLFQFGEGDVCLDFEGDFFLNVWVEYVEGFYNETALLKKRKRRFLKKQVRHIRKDAKFEKIYNLQCLLNNYQSLDARETSVDVISSSLLFDAHRHYFYENNFLDFSELLNDLWENYECVGSLLLVDFYSHNQDVTLNTVCFNTNRLFTSNHASFYMLPETIKKLLLKERRFSTDLVNYKYMQQYLTNFISHYSSLKSLFVLQSNVSKFTNAGAVGYRELVHGLVFYFARLNRKFFKNFNLNLFMETFIFTLLKKDLNYFIKFFKKELEAMPLKKHKRVFYSFEFLLKKFVSKLFFYAGVAGLKFEVSGKISVTGNSKTRNKIIKYGRYSLTNKSLCIDYIHDIIRTTTGVLGFRMFITY